MKTRVNGRITKLFMVLLAATLLVLMIPNGAQARTAKAEKADVTSKDVAKKVNADTPNPHPDLHDAAVYVDDEVDRIAGWGGWDVEIFIDHIKSPASGHFDDNPLKTVGPVIQDGFTKVGIDKDYRLHFYSDDGVTITEIFVSGCEKPGYEMYAWYVQLAGEDNYIGLPEYVDATDPGAWVIGEGMLANLPETINFFAEYIGKVGYNVTGGEGHKIFDCTYTIETQGQPIDTNTYQVDAINSYLWEGGVMSISKDGVLTVTNYDDYNKYTESGQAKAVPKDGYTLKSWTIDGKEYPVGTEASVMTVKYQQAPIKVVANYQANTQTAQTGDSNAIAFAIIGLIVAAGACGIFVGRKSLNK